MRKSFEERLYDQRDLAQHELEQESPDQDWERVVDHNIERLAQEEGVTPETQQQVFEIQKKKQEIMKRLKQDLRNLDDPEHREKIKEGEYRIEFYKGKYIWTRDDGKTQEVTLGDIMTDGEWGIDYFLDPKSIPRNIRKEYLIAVAKHKIQTELNKQIVTAEVDLRPHQRIAYEGAAGLSEESEMNGGLIAERMVLNFMKKIQIDYGLDLEIISADVFQDVVQKIDFIIRRKQHHRGVDVETDNRDSGAAIQFTVKTGEDLEEKRRKLERALQRDIEDVEDVDDVVLVSVPINRVMTTYGIWQQERDPGGPEGWLSPFAKKRIVEGLLKGVFENNEVEELSGSLNKKFEQLRNGRMDEYKQRKAIARDWVRSLHWQGQRDQRDSESQQDESRGSVVELPAMKIDHDSVDNNEAMEELKALELKIHELRQRLDSTKSTKRNWKRRRKMIEQTYGSEHPQVVKLDLQIRALTNDRGLWNEELLALQRERDMQLKKIGQARLVA